MILDWLILSVALFIGLFNRNGLIFALWLSLNTLLWIWYESTGKWSALDDWVTLFWIKDLALMALAGFIGAPLIITLGFAATCIFHQVTSWQIATYTWENVTLFDYRSGFMMYLSVIMLATAIHDTIGGGNGGKRAKYRLFSLHNRLNDVLHLATRKVVK